MYTKIDAWSACSIAMNDYACILIWDAHTHMGRPIRVWASIRIWGRTDTAGREQYFHGVNIVFKGPPWIQVVTDLIRIGPSLSLSIR